MTAPHAVEALLRDATNHWMSNARLTQYQALLLDKDRLTFSKSLAINPATLLLDSNSGEPIHDCSEMLDIIQGTRLDLTDIPLTVRDADLYTDGSSYVRDGIKYAGAAVVTGQKEVIWSQALPRGSSAQKAEIIAVTQALRWAKGKRVNIYTDSNYAFATAHVHGQIYKQRGILTSDGKTIKNKQEILELLEAIWLPDKLAIIHWPGHRKDDSPQTQGNNLADQTAREIAL